MRLHAVTFRDADGDYWTELFMADDHDHAEEQCRNENPESINLVCTVSIPFHLIERAYYLEKARRATL